MDETNWYYDSGFYAAPPMSDSMQAIDMTHVPDEALLYSFNGTPFVQSQHPAPDHPVYYNSMHSSNRQLVDLNPCNLGVAPAGAFAASSQVPSFVNPHPTKASSPDDSLDITGASNMSSMYTAPEAPPPTSDGVRQRLACPFSKCSQSGQEFQCLDKHFENFSRVKEHVRNMHYIPIYCPRCYLTRFRTRQELDRHLRQENICHLRDFKEMYGYNPENKEQNAIIGQRANPGKSEEERWKKLFTALFPGYIPPDSIYAA